MEILKDLKNNLFQDIVISSKKLKEGDVFFCDFKAESFINEEIINKSSNIYVNNNFYDRNKIEKNSKIIEIENFRKFFVSKLKNKYKIPLKLIAITGTKGKTSSCWHIFNLLRMISGKNVSYFGSIGFYIGNKNEYKKIRDLDLSTPDIDDIYRILNESVESKVEYCVFEASSHGLHQSRLDGLEIDIASFTNLSQDHLDYFKDVEDTFEAKKILFTKYLKNDGFLISNSDIPQCDILKKISQEFKLNFNSYGQNGNIFKLLEIKRDGIFQFVKFIFNSKEYSFETDIIGGFQIYNILNALSVCNILGFNIQNLLFYIKELSAPCGRLELVKPKDKQVEKLIFVDHAHTPYSLYSSIKALNEIKKGRLITIFGCGGNRDKIKRPVMGYIAVKFSDISIITSDNPRFEEPEDIINDIFFGIENNIEKITHFDYSLAIEEIETMCNYDKIEKPIYYKELDRAKAIKFGTSLMKENDILLIAGKGNETYQIIKDKKHYFSDHKEILKYV